jgi:tetratricopeptide (TPR) repeat protein
MRMMMVAALLPLLAAAPGCKSRRRAAPDARAAGQGQGGGATLPEHGPLSQKIHFEQAKSLLRAGKPAEAVERFRRAIAAHDEGPLRASCYLGLGSALGDLGRHAEAVKAYKRVVELMPDDPEGYRALAIGHEDAGQLERAVEALEQALALDADQLSAYQDLAGLYLRQKKLEQAKKVYLRYEFRRTALIKTLGLAKDPDRRLLAARALGEARDEATAKALGLALTDADRGVRLAVIRALGEQGLQAGAGPLRALLARTADAGEQREIQIALKAIARAPQPGSQPVPTPGAGAGSGS